MPQHSGTSASLFDDEKTSAGGSKVSAAASRKDVDESKLAVETKAGSTAMAETKVAENTAPMQRQAQEIAQSRDLEADEAEYTQLKILQQLPKYRGILTELVDLQEEGDQGFYNSARLPKELNLLLENHDELVREMKASTNWNAWPETNLYKANEGKDWKVVPFLHTFPATDAANSEWVETNCKQCPKTVALLKKIPGIRTALYSRMSPGCVLTAHTGWADLSNHVIRCHIPLVLRENSSGVWVLGKAQFHTLKPKPQLLVFDDSKVHLGFNMDEDRFRCVLIVDVVRPEWIPPGSAKGGMTTHLTAYIDRFRQEVNRVKDPEEQMEAVKW